MLSSTKWLAKNCRRSAARRAGVKDRAEDPWQVVDPVRRRSGVEWKECHDGVHGGRNRTTRLRR